MNSTEQLNKLTDELNEELKKFENWLRSMNMGVAAYVQTNNGFKLGFAKFNGVFCLVITDDDNNDETPLLNASRYNRLHSVNYLEDVYIALRDEYRKETVTMANALTVVREINNRLTHLV